MCDSKASRMLLSPFTRSLIAIIYSRWRFSLIIQIFQVFELSNIADGVTLPNGFLLRTLRARLLIKTNLIIRDDQPLRRLGDINDRNLCLCRYLAINVHWWSIETRHEAGTRTSRLHSSFGGARVVYSHIHSHRIGFLIFKGRAFLWVVWYRAFVIY